MANDVEHFFMSLLTICIYYSVSCLFIYFWSVLFFYCWLFRFLCIFQLLVLFLDMCSANISHIYNLSFHSLNRVFCRANFKILVRYNLSVFSFYEFYDFKSKNSLPNKQLRAKNSLIPKILSYFFRKNFTVLHLAFNFVALFELIFV